MLSVYSKLIKMSDWKAKARARKAFREMSAGPEETKHSPKKNYIRWCGGHKGREHDFVWVKYKSSEEALAYTCAICGRRNKTIWWEGFSLCEAPAPTLGSREPLKRRKVKKTYD